MNFKLKLSLKAYIFICDDKSIFYFDNETYILSCRNISTNQIIWDLKLKNSFYAINLIDGLIYLDGGDIFYEISKEGEILIDQNTLGFSIYLRDGFFKNVVALRKNEDKSRSRGIYSLRKKRILFWLDFKIHGYPTIIEDYIFASFSLKLRDEILRISESGQPIWHFNLDSLYESHASQLAMYNLGELSYITEPLLQINNLIGVLNNLLWVDVDVQMRGSFLLALDTETGAVVHLLQTTELQTAMPEHLYYYKKLRRTAKSHLDVENNMILGFGADFDHWQVDLTQPEPIIKFWYLEENFKSIPEAHAVQIDFSGITPTHIFFPNSHGHFPQVIAFNRKTMQVDWRQVFNDEKGYFSPKQVKANDTHLFVHMSDNSLHIFEKTED